MSAMQFTRGQYVRSDKSNLVRPPRIWTAFAALVADLVIRLLTVNLAAVLWLHCTSDIDHEGDLRGRGTYLADCVAFQLFRCFSPGAVCLGVSISAAFLSPIPMHYRLRLVKPRLARRYVLYWIALAVGLGLITSSVVTLSEAELPLSVMEHERLLSCMTTVDYALFLLIVGLLVPAGEELLFRGYLQTRLCKRWGRGKGIVVVSVFFAASHFQGEGFVGLFLSGVLYGYVSELSQSIIPSILCHSAHNILASTVFYPLIMSRQRGLALVVLVASIPLMIHVAFALARSVGTASPGDC